MPENQTSFLPQQDEFFIRGEAVSKSNCPITFNVNKTGVPPSISYFEGRFYLSVVAWVGDSVVDMRFPLEPRELAYLMSQGAKSMAQYFAYNEAERRG